MLVSVSELYIKCGFKLHFCDIVNIINPQFCLFVCFGKVLNRGLILLFVVQFFGFTVT